MTVEKKIGPATNVAAGSNVHGAINDRINRVETATLGTATLTLSGTSRTLTAEEWYDGAVIVLAGTPSGNYTLNVPGGQRVVTLVNTTGVEITVQISGQSATAPIIPPKSASGSLSDIQGQTADMHSDGTNVRWSGVPTFILTEAEYTALTAVSNGAEYHTI